MPTFFGGLAFKLIAGLIGAGAVVAYILILNANLDKKDAQIKERDTALVSAVIKINNSRERVKEMARINAEQVKAVKAAADARERAYKESAKLELEDAQRGETIIRTITKWREKDETLNQCLAFKLPDDFVRQLEH